MRVKKAFISFFRDLLFIVIVFRGSVFEFDHEQMILLAKHIFEIFFVSRSTLKTYKNMNCNVIP
jgi:hypothetical protein